MKIKDEKCKDIARVVGPLVQGVLGSESKFILIPFVDSKDKTEMAVITDLHPAVASAVLAKAGIQTMESLEKIKSSGECPCEDCKKKRAEEAGASSIH